MKWAITKVDNNWNVYRRILPIVIGMTKNNKYKHMKQFLFCVAVLFSATGYAQNIGIGTLTPDASAMLEISAANKGLLIPRVSLLSPTDVVTVPTPAPGLLLISTNNNVVQMPDGAGFYVWTGSNWTKLLLRLE